ncbi:MAG: hypothetical protein KF901_17810 [Myxococcales bacterium]|nr:hypothetical protein [Myxococcales bacterium]
MPAERARSSPKDTRGVAKASTHVAAVALPQLRLQLVLRRHARWEGSPVAVVADEGPEAPLLELDRLARRRGLRPGIRHGVARSLVPELRTAVVREEELATLREELARALQTFSPRVEPVCDEVGGAFFVDPRGLEGLFGGADVWADSVHRYLRGRKLRAAVVVGHHPWLALALARNAHRPKVFSDSEAEREAAHALSLRNVGFPESLCDPLAMLGVETLGAFAALPHGELRTRFGREAAALHRRYGDDGQLPLQPLALELPRRVQHALDAPTTELEPLLFGAKTALDRLLSELAERGEHPEALLVELQLERHAPAGPIGAAPRTLTDDERVVVERIEPAAPTRDARIWLELLRLRLASLDLLAAAEEIALEAEPTAARAEQLRTSTERARRDPTAAARALARVRATFGDASVTRARLHDAHLPEARFRYEPLRHLTLPRFGAEPPVSSASVDVSPTSPAVPSPASSSTLRIAPEQERDEGSEHAEHAAPRGLTLLHHETGGSDLSSSMSSPQVRSSAHDVPSSHDALSPSAASYDALSLSAASHDALSPSAASHDALLPSAASHDALLPSAASHDALSPSAIAPREALQRRLLSRPRRLVVDAEGRPKPAGERVQRLFGPHRTSGGWWGRPEPGQETERDYYYAEVESGALYWIFYDRPRAAWFLHGFVD